MEQKDILKIIGGRPLKGEIPVNGAKNSKAIIATLLTDQECWIHNTPDISDVRLIRDLNEVYDRQAHFNSFANIFYKASEKAEPTMPQERDLLPLIGRSRFPVLFLGPLIARFGEAKIPGTGGCDIGPRPIDFHIDLLEKMGARVERNDQIIQMSAPDGLRGTNIELPYPSVGATEQAILAASLARGETRIVNAAMEPEVVDLTNIIQKMGGIVSINPYGTINIEGVHKLNGFNHTLMPDRIEAASWACAAAATNGEIFVKGASQDGLQTFLSTFKKAGGAFDIIEEGIHFRRSKEGLSGIVPLQTDVHPGFATDWQQPFTTLLTQAKSFSLIHETVYEDRLGFTKTLIDMGAKIELYNECLSMSEREDCRFKYTDFMHSAVIHGPTRLHGRDVVVPDLRGGFSYIIAALMAEGMTTLSNVNLLKRGYPSFTTKLATLGAEIVQ